MQWTLDATYASVEVKISTEAAKILVKVICDSAASQARHGRVNFTSTLDIQSICLKQQIFASRCDRVYIRSYFAFDSMPSMVVQANDLSRLRGAHVVRVALRTRNDGHTDTIRYGRDAPRIVLTLRHVIAISTMKAVHQDGRVTTGILVKKLLDSQTLELNRKSLRATTEFGH
ncbi:hypothetical protein BDR04DRAFT_1116712 [Suillus decipiens]|nr:hypothetical protein BDR04DRAFT_1116712 [Suillus decipiens]